MQSEEAPPKCSECGGSGRQRVISVTAALYGFPGVGQRDEECPACGGGGDPPRIRLSPRYSLTRSLTRSSMNLRRRYK